MKGKEIKEEAGFTLVEVLVTILMMSMVVMALYSMFDMSLRVYSVGNSAVETNENARVALDRMEREIRSAWPSDNCMDATPSEDPLVTPLSGDPSASSSDSITFKNCLPDESTAEPDDALLTQISYSFETVDGEVILRRSQTTGPPTTTQSLASLGSSDTPLSFRYLDAGGTPIAAENAVLVEIKLEAKDGDQTQTLITNAGLRNAN